MSWIKDYNRSGGWGGHAFMGLKRELANALKNKKAPLHGAAQKFEAGQLEEAVKELMLLLFKEPESLSEDTKTFLHVLLSQSAVEFAEQNINDDDVLERLPLKAVKYAAIGIGEKSGYRTSKSSAGRKKGLKKKEAVLKAWKERANRKISYTAWAASYFKRNGGRFDKNGEAVGSPTPRTIARWIGEHESNRAKK